MWWMWWQMWQWMCDSVDRQRDSVTDSVTVKPRQTAWRRDSEQRWQRDGSVMNSVTDNVTTWQRWQRDSVTSVTGLQRVAWQRDNVNRQRERTAWTAWQRDNVTTRWHNVIIMFQRLSGDNVAMFQRWQLMIWQWQRDSQWQTTNNNVTAWQRDSNDSHVQRDAYDLVLSTDSDDNVTTVFYSNVNNSNVFSNVFLTWQLCFSHVLHIAMI
jgi:hypothetical protein